MIDTADLVPSIILQPPFSFQNYLPWRVLSFSLSLSLSHISRINLTSKVIIQFFNYFIPISSRIVARSRTISFSNLYHISFSLRFVPVIGQNISNSLRLHRGIEFLIYRDAKHIPCLEEKFRDASIKSISFRIWNNVRRYPNEILLHKLFYSWCA